MSSNHHSATTLHCWLTVLDAMSESVAQMLHSVDCRDGEFADGNSDNSIPAVAEFQCRLDNAIHGLEQRLDAAKTLAARIEDCLDRDEHEVRAWRAAADAARTRLATRAQL